MKLTFDTEVIWCSDTFVCNLHIIGNHSSEYERPRSKNERGVRITNRTKV